MSTENVKAFLIKMEEDESLRNSMVDINLEGSNEAIVSAIQKKAARAGFDFTEEEFNQVAKPQKIEQNDEELGDDELEMIAGGRGDAKFAAGLGPFKEYGSRRLGICFGPGVTWEL